MEPCPSFRPWHDKATGKTILKPTEAKCLHEEAAQVERLRYIFSHGIKENWSHISLIGRGFT